MLTNDKLGFKKIQKGACRIFHFLILDIPFLYKNFCKAYHIPIVRERFCMSLLRDKLMGFLNGAPYYRQEGVGSDERLCKLCQGIFHPGHL